MKKLWIMAVILVLLLGCNTVPEAPVEDASTLNRVYLTQGAIVLEYSDHYECYGVTKTERNPSLKMFRFYTQEIPCPDNLEERLNISSDAPDQAT